MPLQFLGDVRADHAEVGVDAHKLLTLKVLDCEKTLARLTSTAEKFCLPFSWGRYGDGTGNRRYSGSCLVALLDERPDVPDLFSGALRTYPS